MNRLLCWFIRWQDRRYRHWLRCHKVLLQPTKFSNEKLPSLLRKQAE